MVYAVPATVIASGSSVYGSNLTLLPHRPNSLAGSLILLAVADGEFLSTPAADGDGGDGASMVVQVKDSEMGCMQIRARVRTL